MEKKTRQKTTAKQKKNTTTKGRTRKSPAKKTVKKETSSKEKATTVAKTTKPKKAAPAKSPRKRASTKTTKKTTAKVETQKVDKQVKEPKTTTTQKRVDRKKAESKETKTKNTPSEYPTSPLVTIRQSVAILIDGNNIEMSIHAMLKKKKAMINFDTLVPKLLKERGLNRLIYFREGKSISSKLAERLHNLYYGTVVPCHKSADIPLTIAATQIAEKVDTIIILSGDADYVELVKHLTSRGVRVEIAAVEQTTASILRQAADHFFGITEEDCFVLG